MVCDPSRGGLEVRNAILLCLRLALAGLFFYAGVVKAGASQEFAIALLPFTLVPPEWTMPLALSLAWIEILAAILLLLPRIFPLGAALVCALCVLFISVLSWALWNGIVVSCGCFGADNSPSAWKMLLAIGRDILLLAAASAILVLPRIGKNT
ncbi:MAG: DoxX family membrane protein [Proteobacteria bacterium]|nr:DoxX family membrane protein [Pseudomonadota bacterium]